VTCFYCILDLDTGELTYASGGHNYPLVYRTATGKVEQLSAQGIVLGIVPEPRFEQHSMQLDPGDVVVFYTDGVTEARSGDELFGEDRLAAVLAGVECEPGADPGASTHLADAVADAVLRAVKAFASERDDIALLVLTAT
jgi:sigma-B regulation protein RsbU (phosphoserine phosphatase)